MEVEPHIVFEGIEPSESIRTRIESEIEKLERFFGRITACRVSVSKPQQRHSHGDLYAAAVHLTLPNGLDIHADRNPPKDHAREDVYVAIRDVFSAARRQLQDEARKLRGDVKHHDDPPAAVVGTIVAEEDYGFLETEDGREIYFHRNSVVNRGFDKLSVGDHVIFTEAAGDKGPQASTVRPV
ncbi:MAG: HPF/RaiA family ribosome-associated protein [Pseudomonadota bacterium]